MGYNALANRPTTAGVPPRPRPKTAQEAIIEMLKQRAANPTAAPTVSPSIATSLTNNQKPSATVRDMPQLQKLAKDMNINPTATVQKAYATTPDADQNPDKKQEPQPQPYKPNYGDMALDTAVNAGTNYLGNSLFGESTAAPSTPAVVGTTISSGPSAPTVVDAGLSAASSAPSVSSTIDAGTWAASSAPSVNSTIDAGTWAADTIADYNMINDVGTNAASLGAEQAAANAAAVGAEEAAANSAAIGAGAAAAGTPWFQVGGPSYAGYIGAAGAVANGALNWDDWGKRGEDYRNTREEQQVAAAVGNYFTGGLASTADGALRALLPHFMNELDEFGNKYGPMGNLTRLLGSKKDKDQQARDAVRSNLKDNGFIDENYNLTNADGTKFDIGKDGSIKNYNLDPNEPGMAEKIGKAQAVAVFLTGGDEKLTSDFTGYLVRAASSSGDFDENLRGYVKQGGLDHDSIYAGINAMASREDKPLDRARADTYLNGLDQLFGTGAYAEGSGERSGGKKKSKSNGSSKSEDKPITPIAPPVPKDSPPPQTAQPVSGDDYVQAIVAVNDANSVNKKKRKNPLSNGF